MAGPGKRVGAVGTAWGRLESALAGAGPGLGLGLGQGRGWGGGWRRDTRSLAAGRPAFPLQGPQHINDYNIKPALGAVYRKGHFPPCYPYNPQGMQIKIPIPDGNLMATESSVEPGLVQAHPSPRQPPGPRAPRELGCAWSRAPPGGELRLGLGTASGPRAVRCHSEGRDQGFFPLLIP